VLGEAARRLMLADPGLEQPHPTLTPRAAYSARNRIAHGYSTVDYDIVWVAAVASVPLMVAVARTILETGTL